MNTDTKQAGILPMGEADDCPHGCGNHSSADGFYPCDKNGRLREPTRGWPSIYRCERCEGLNRLIPDKPKGGAQ